jgi:adenosylcobinamide kinase/adenosylcobinamide-phosphate guanylyltransferase
VKLLVLGGVRSGKSRYAESLGRAAAGPVTLIATGTAGDDEMAVRIAAHRAQRPRRWRVIEEPIHLSQALLAAAPSPGVTKSLPSGESAQTAESPGTTRCTCSTGPVIIVDCLTLWLTNLLCHSDGDLLETEIEALFHVLPSLTASVVFVSNEVGFGIMPVNELARRFADHAGILHQRLAVLVDRVVLMVAGLAVTIKGVPP